MSVDKQKQWLTDNTFKCQRFGARITKAACAKYQYCNQTHLKNLLAGGTMMMPGCCHGCPQAQDKDETIKSRAFFGWRKTRKTRQKSGRL